MTADGSEVDGVAAFITEDGHAIVPSEARPGEYDAGQAASGQDPLAAYTAALGPGLQDVPDGRFEETFEAAMRDTVLSNLDATEALAHRLYRDPPAIAPTQDLARRIAEKEERLGELESQLWDTLEGVGLAVTEIGLTIGAAMTTGGTSLALTLAGAGVGLADTGLQVSDYLVQRPASNTAFAPHESLVDPDQVANQPYWIAVSLVGNGLDVMQAAKAVKALQAGRGLEAAKRARA